MDLGKKIKILRVKKGLSQEQLAEKIHKTRTLISHIEITSKVNFYTLNEIADALNVTVSYFSDTDIDNQFVFEDKETYNSLKSTIQNQKKEIELLNEIVVNQKEIIKQLKKK